MQIQTLFTALVAGSMLLTAQSFAQSSAPKKQPTQEGGGSTFLACGPEYNANPAGDPNCKQHTSATPTQGSQTAPK
jgi:hypothetical protein